MPSDSEYSNLSLHMSSTSESSLLDDDVLLRRLQRVEKALITARDAVFSIIRTSYGTCALPTAYSMQLYAITGIPVPSTARPVLMKITLARLR